VKAAVSDLALFGGTPAFEADLHVGRPNIGDRAKLLHRIEEILDSRWLTNDGPTVREFERQVAAITGVEHCVAMCNATVALEAAARAAGLAGEVIMPAFTFVASAHAFRWLGLRPVFADIDPETLTIDPDHVAALITPRTSAVVGVHVFGRTCAVDRIQAIADRGGLTVIYDAAHALACSRGGVMVGGFGDMEVFSFHATKFINAFEGGALTTNRADVADELRKARNFGFEGYDRVTTLGINGKMTEVCAAMGLTSLEALDDIVATNRRNHAAYSEGLAGIPGVRVLGYPAAEHNNYQYVVALVDSAEAGLTRDEIVELLHAERVLARRYFFPGCHRMAPYASEQPAARLPVTDRLSEQVMSLPTGTAVTTRDVEAVVDLIGDFVRMGSAIRARRPEWTGDRSLP
jgi:dTDP-4-amino-4,6-dideoxygalactose transaminase